MVKPREGGADRVRAHDVDRARDYLAGVWPVVGKLVLPELSSVDVLVADPQTAVMLVLGFTGYVLHGEDARDDLAAGGPKGMQVRFRRLGAIIEGGEGFSIN